MCGSPLASDEVCGDQLLRWTETLAGGCDQVRPGDRITVVGCVQHDVDDSDASFSETRFALGVVSAAVLGLIYLVAYGAR